MDDRYEDLKNTTTRVETLGKMVKFLGLEASQERLECAFVLADRGDTHRRGSSRRADHRYITKKEIYSRPSIACRIWDSVSRYAGGQGYTIYGGSVDCSEY